MNRPPPSAIAVVVRVPWEASYAHPTGQVLAAAIRAALSTVEGQSADPDTDAPRRLDVVAIGPHQITRLDGDELVTVTYPAGTTTVLSVQPDGTIQTRPAGANGPYERAVLKPDRLVYAPVGPAGQVYLVPYADQLPNPE
ncbi:MAG TPA: hypothetical protein VNM36_08920 [Gemmatimonadaceae bacterium]|nr:hypothetical protein [Gemmatimonadaceae bacterium]